MPRVSVSDGGLHIVADLEGASAKPTALFLHGGGENRSVWQPITQAIVERGWRTIAPDLRGHGESGRAPHYHLDDFVLDVERVIEKLGDQPLVIVGGSIGGGFGLIVAGEERLPVAGLVLLDVPTSPRPESARGERDRIVAAHSRGAEPLASVDPEIMRGSFVDDVIADFGRWRRAARAVRIPTLLIRGERSVAVGPEELKAMKDDIPQVEVVSLAAGHLVARDCPGDVAAQLVRFLARVLPASA